MKKERLQAELNSLKQKRLALEERFEKTASTRAEMFAMAKESAKIDIEKLLKTAAILLIVFGIFNKLQNRQKIHSPPGAKLNAFARLIYSKRIYERIFMQLVVDMREEHAEALQGGRHRLARWIAIRGWFTMAMTMVTYAFASCGKTFIKIWRMTP